MDLPLLASSTRYFLFFSIDVKSYRPLGISLYFQAEKRAVHNALERKRRDHIKDMFSQLKDSVPNMAGEKISTKVLMLSSIQATFRH
jgi:hypothetical protein